MGTRSTLSAGARRSPSRTASRPPGARARWNASVRPAGPARSLCHVGVAPTTTHGRENRVKESCSRAGADCVRALSDGGRGERGRCVEGLRLQQRARGRGWQELHRTAIQQRPGRREQRRHDDRDLCRHLHRTDRNRWAGQAGRLRWRGQRHPRDAGDAGSVRISLRLQNRTNRKARSTSPTRSRSARAARSR